MKDPKAHPSYLGWQVDWPVFVKIPFSAFGKPWKKSEHFNWHSQIGADPSKIYQLYAAGYIYHNQAMENTQKVGDRLGEMNSEQLLSVVLQLNDHLKRQGLSKEQLTKKRCKQSKIDDKQRGLIRSFLRQQSWIEDTFYDIRDSVLKE